MYTIDELLAYSPNNKGKTREQIEENKKIAQQISDWRARHAQYREEWNDVHYKKDILAPFIMLFIALAVVIAVCVVPLAVLYIYTNLLPLIIATITTVCLGLMACALYAYTSAIAHKITTKQFNLDTDIRSISGLKLLDERSIAKAGELAGTLERHYVGEESLPLRKGEVEVLAGFISQLADCNEIQNGNLSHLSDVRAVINRMCQTCKTEEKEYTEGVVELINKLSEIVKKEPKNIPAPNIYHDRPVNQLDGARLTANNEEIIRT